MRLRERDKRDVILRACTGLNDDAYTWGEATAIRAAVYPAGRRLDPQVYGERVTDMRLLLYDGSLALEVGMGVALRDGPPEWRIDSLEAWTHQTAVLERIPEGRRGDGA